MSDEIVFVHTEAEAWRSGIHGGGGAQFAAFPEHQARRREISLQQVRAVGAFHRHDAVAERLRQGECGAGQDAGFTNMRADDDADAPTGSFFGKGEGSAATRPSSISAS